MNSLQDDIIKYKSGQLSPKEMHALEKRALEDPFLADALEGVENISPEDLTKDIARLNKKIPQQNKTIWFTPLRIAAGVILVAASLVLLYQLRPEPETLALKNEEPLTPTPESKPEPIIEVDKEKVQQAKRAEETKREENFKALKTKREKEKPGEAKTKTDRTPSLADKAETSKPAQEKQPQEFAHAPAPEKKPDEVREEVKEAPVSIAVQPTQQLAADEDAKKEKVAARARKYAAKSEVASGGAAGPSPVSSKEITGKVSSAEDGTPLPGVNVVVEGTTIGTVTDAAGNFSLQAPNEKQKLVFSFIGMETREEDIKGKTNVDVTLKQDASQLSEVVVTALGIKRDDDSEPNIRSASPVGGMRAYNKYLDTNVRYPDEARKDNIKGKVKVEFSVKTDGRLDDYKVVKSLGHGCDEEVIRLIKDGPRWSPGTENGQPVESTVLVGVKFDPAKAGR